MLVALNKHSTVNTQAYLMEKDTESDTFLSYNKFFTENLSLGLGYNYYSFIKNVDNSMGEWAVTASYKKLSLISSYVDKFSGVDTNYWHSNATYTQDLTDKLNLVLSAGRTYFGNANAVASTSYYDYHVGLQANVEGFKTEVFYTNTWNRVNPYTGDYTKQDGTFTVAVSKTLSLL